MRLLFVLQIGKNDTVQKVRKQQRALAGLATEFSCDFDTVIVCDATCFEETSFIGDVFILGIKILNPKTIAGEIVRFLKDKPYQGILIGEDTFANDIAVLLAYEKQLQCITNVIDLQRIGNSFTFTRFAYSNNIYVDFQVRKPFVVSVRTLSSSKTKVEGIRGNYTYLESKTNTDAIRGQEIVLSNDEIVQKEVLFACGMGIRKREDIQKIRTFAQTHGFSFGVTRPVAMRGWASISEIIGVSGTIFSPKICVTIGVSGSAAFYVGIENSECIVTINTDESATIISQSDRVIIDSYENVLDHLLTQFSQTTHE
jgi:electron transfer flavoprotein alpha subunit